MTEEKIQRINVLYRKMKEEGLTEEEKLEQQELRKQFISDFRKNLRGQLDNISLVDEDGTVTNLGEKHGEKEGH